MRQQQRGDAVSLSVTGLSLSAVIFPWVFFFSPFCLFIAHFTSVSSVVCQYWPPCGVFLQSTPPCSSQAILFYILFFFFWSSLSLTVPLRAKKRKRPLNKARPMPLWQNKKKKKSANVHKLFSREIFLLRTLIFWSDRTFPDRRCITQRTGVFTAKLVSLETQISHQKGTEIPDESGIQRNWNLFLASAGRASSCPENLVKQCLMKCQDHVHGTSVYPRSLCVVLF